MSEIPPKFRNYVAKPIRPIAEYASVAWSPCTPKDISAIDHESIQRRAAHFFNVSFFGSCFISRAAKTENPVPRSFFATKPEGNACYAG